MRVDVRLRGAAAPRHLRVQPALRLSRHAALAGVRASAAWSTTSTIGTSTSSAPRSTRPASRARRSTRDRNDGLRSACFGYKLTRYPLQTFRLLRRFLRFMPLRDVFYLIVKPFLGEKPRPDQERGAVPRRRARRDEGRRGGSHPGQRRAPRGGAACLARRASDRRPRRRRRRGGRVSVGGLSDRRGA